VAASETVVNEVRQRIFEGRYPPGSPLRELTIAREFSVSQATVREALQRLEHAGLVSRTANVGSTVTRLSPKDIRERVELRAILEIKAAQEASARMTDDDYLELQRRLDVMEQSVAADRYYEAAQADLAFHHFIWERSGNETLCRHLELVTTPLFAFISILRSQGLQRLTTVVEAHQPLIDALRSGDAERIRIEFGSAAINPYLVFTGNGPEKTLASAFGFLQTTIS
jgi:DNA-binding GntR family transcriptional regulator